ncbi:MAG: hypothetical protein IKE73_02360 [Bacilli bacterium]|nr:hypothetical protein [Bacilli bacterium]
MKSNLKYAILLVLLLFITNVNAITIPRNNNYKYGYSNKMEGNTIIVSIFTSDINNKFDDGNKKMIFDNLRNSTNYLTNEVDKYNKKINFIYNKSDLNYYANFNINIVDNDVNLYKIQSDWIRKNINIDRISYKYRANNIVFLFFIDTNYDNDVVPWTISKNKYNNIKIEYSNIYLKFDNIDTLSSIYVHEIMHQFGAHDLYNENMYINNNYVSYLNGINSNDIMYKITDSNEIVNDFSEIDAYYVGLIDNSKIVEEFNLKENDY